ncbi:MAG: ATP-binding protein [Stigonema ocellatum SAG 48.90 = DSM 106950]|nr:ATP-binding protein [Stigonema ocellatum SAG 48.90 = DSM 106950]
MFEYLLVENLGIFSRLEWKNHKKINIIIGENDTGKTYILKILYCIAKSVEEYTKCSETDDKSWKEILSDKMFSVYQPVKRQLGEIVNKSSNLNRLNVETRLRSEEYSFYFIKDTKDLITRCNDTVYKQFDLNALYLPNQEIITAFDAIEAVNEKLKIFGFDQTYQDLIEALRLPTSAKKLDKPLENVLDSLENLFSGNLALERKRFIFKRGREKYYMPQVAESIKKISILTTLIRNRTIKKGTILFIDEPETNLHPRAIIALCNMLFSLSQIGVQIYLATHSYFVIKQFEILARKYQESIDLCCLEKKEEISVKFYDLKEGMPDNSIIDASISLYEEDVRLDLEA